MAITRSLGTLDRRLHATLVDLVVVDLGGPEDVLAAASLAREFPSVAFVAVTPFRAVDAPAIAACANCGVADVLADGVDDGMLRHAVTVHGFSTRFATALAEPPRELGLETRIQRSAWRFIAGRAGRVVRTQELAKALAVTREHLSRSFGHAGKPQATLKRVIDLVRLLAAAELAKNPGYDLRDVVRLLGYASVSQLSAVAERLVGRPATSLARLRPNDLIEGFVRTASRGLVSSGTL
ncbi:MAG TPA: helix-turn-helix domain-containing protein [Gemmatimonadaceae bacterium]|nr:helix-turn-helix domain-containing protein [Gemmatimonadaceae bacterium]